jgi:hypothetical protein
MILVTGAPGRTSAIHFSRQLPANDCQSLMLQGFAYFSRSLLFRRINILFIYTTECGEKQGVLERFFLEFAVQYI